MELHKFGIAERSHLVICERDPSYGSIPRCTLYYFLIAVSHMMSRRLILQSLSSAIVFECNGTSDAITLNGPVLIKTH